MKIYDRVELIREKPAYTREGVRKGDFGTIILDKSIDGTWDVIFSEFYTGKDIAELAVAEEDLKVYERVPPERLPPKPQELKESGRFRLSSACKIESLDIVELIREKPEYTKAGVRKGAFGLVDGLYDGALQVTFSEFCTGKFIAKIPVAEEDLQVYDVVPPEKYPPRNEHSGEENESL